jgi:hypothetical protein
LRDDWIKNKVIKILRSDSVSSSKQEKRKANSKEQFRKHRKENPKSKQRSFFGQP